MTTNVRSVSPSCRILVFSILLNSCLKGGSKVTYLVFGKPKTETRLARSPPAPRPLYTLPLLP